MKSPMKESHQSALEFFFRAKCFALHSFPLIDIKRLNNKFQLKVIGVSPGEPTVVGSQGMVGEYGLAQTRLNDLYRVGVRVRV